MRQWRRSPIAKGLAALALVAMLVAPAAVRADGSGPDEPPGPGDRVVKIGPQAVVIVNERGEVRMYDDDPSQQAPTCRTRLWCWGTAFGELGVLGSAVYEELTDSVQGSGGPLESTSSTE